MLQYPLIMFFLLLLILSLMRCSNLSATAVRNMRLRNVVNIINVNQKHARLIGRDRAMFKCIAEGEALSKYIAGKYILLKTSSLKNIRHLKGWEDLWAAVNDYTHQQRALSISLNAFIEQNKPNIEEFSQCLRKNGILIDKSESGETFEKLELIDSGISAGESSSIGGSASTSMTGINLETSGSEQNYDTEQTYAGKTMRPSKPATPAKVKSTGSRIPILKSGSSPRISTPRIKNGRVPATPPVSPISRTEKYSRHILECQPGSISYYRLLKQETESILESVQTLRELLTDEKTTDAHARRDSLSDDNTTRSTTDNTCCQDFDSNVSSKRLSPPTTINNNQNLVQCDRLKSMETALKSVIADFEDIIASLSG